MDLKKLKLGGHIPSFNLKGTDGNFYRDSTFSDEKILLVVFSCNHCPYVKAYEDRLIKLQDDYREKGLVVIAINSNDDLNYPEDSFENMRARSEEKAFNFLYLRDDSQEIAKAFGAASTPEIFLFNKQKKLSYIGKIDDNWSNPLAVNKQYLRDAIDEIINNEQVSVPETFAVGCSIKWK